MAQWQKRPPRITSKQLPLISYFSVIGESLAEGRSFEYCLGQLFLHLILSLFSHSYMFNLKHGHFEQDVYRQWIEIQFCGEKTGDPYKIIHTLKIKVVMRIVGKKNFKSKIERKTNKWSNNWPSLELQRKRKRSLMK